MTRFKQGDCVKGYGLGEYYICGIEYGSGDKFMRSSNQEDIYYTLSRRPFMKQPCQRVHGSVLKLADKGIPIEAQEPANID